MKQKPKNMSQNKSLKTKISKKIAQYLFKMTRYPNQETTPESFKKNISTKLFKKISLKTFKNL